MSIRRCSSIAAAAALCLATATKGQQAADILTKEDLVARHPEISVDDISEGPFPGLYEIVIGGAITYVTTDGRFQLKGEIVDIDKQTNITEQRRAANRAAELREIDPKTEILFTPKTGVAKHHVTIFTDVDCGYCRRLHREIAMINALGIEVRYVAFPRTGPDTPSWEKAQHVWCAADRGGALTQAKLGADIASTSGCDAPMVHEQYELGLKIGVTGTPAVYAETGELLGGYLPPDQLLAKLEAVSEAQN